MNEFNEWKNDETEWKVPNVKKLTNIKSETRCYTGR